MNSYIKPLVLCILDGWGVSNNPDNRFNAITQANPIYWNHLLENYPNSTLKCSGETVGLPANQMGNSEVGHTIIGSGRIVYQDLVRINKEIESNRLKDNEFVIKLINRHVKSNKAVHLLGLCSDGGVHSHINHLCYLAKILGKQGIKVRMHLFLDGRDVLPRSAEKYLKQIQELEDLYSSIKIATISGRYYAMDRDNRIERTELAVSAIAYANANKFLNWKEYLEKHEAQDITDEFMLPEAQAEYQGIESGDSICFINFRSDRVRQLASSLLDLPIDYCMKIGMTHYSRELDKKLDTLFYEQFIRNGLGELIANRQFKQLRIAETEKYAHVTFFFNGGIEEPFIGEDRILIPSPKVKTYDLQPEMSAFVMTEELIEAIKLNKYNFIVVNYANADMVGHTGDIKASIKAVEAIDKCLELLTKAVSEVSGTLIITADHGNVEQMFDTENTMSHTSHTTNPVPFVLISSEYERNKVILKDGNLADVAPTILKIMNISIPAEMTGKPLF